MTRFPFALLSLVLFCGSVSAQGIPPAIENGRVVIRPPDYGSASVWINYASETMTTYRVQWAYYDQFNVLISQGTVQDVGIQTQIDFIGGSGNDYYANATSAPEFRVNTMSGNDTVYTASSAINVNLGQGEDYCHIWAGEGVVWAVAPDGTPLGYDEIYSESTGVVEIYVDYGDTVWEQEWDLVYALDS